MNAIIDQIEQAYLKKNLPAIRVGDLVRLDVKVIEGESERLQAFEGVVIAKKGHGISETFTVRKVSFGVGVERTFPVHSPRLEKIKVIRSGKVRRAKLYYLRNLTGKAARIEEKESGPSASAKEMKAAPASESVPVVATGASEAK